MDAKELDLTEVDDGKVEFLSAVGTLATIRTDDEFRAAGEMAKEIKRRLGLIKGLFDPLIEKNKVAKAAAEAARKAVADAAEKYSEPFTKADAALRLAMARYQSEKEAAERAERRRLEDIARKEAEDARIAEAEKTNDASILDAPIVAIPVKLEVSSPVVEGVTFATTWHYKASGEPLDPAFTMKDDHGFPVPDHKKIKSIVTALKGDTMIRGVAVYSEKQMRVAA